MSTRNFPRLLLAIASGAAVALCAPAVEAQEPSTTTAPNTVQAASSQSSAVALSFGVPDVLKLSRAHVSDDTIVAFIGNSGRTYNLGASEIVYLHEQGVSERVITTMLNQRRKPEEAPAPAPQAPPPAQSSATYVQSEPASTPSSSVYVFPSSSAYNYYPTYGYYPYPYYSYYPYYGGYSYWPSISLAFAYGNYNYHNHGYYGGYYHGGGYHGGNWNGGGGWHGGGSGSGGWHGGGGGWTGGGGSHGGGGMGGGGGHH
jgi:hypothetical protein